VKRRVDRRDFVERRHRHEFRSPQTSASIIGDAACSLRK
jgi:hypothetical protein